MLCRHFASVACAAGAKTPAWRGTATKDEKIGWESAVIDDISKLGHLVLVTSILMKS
jgi:hypothetical protein